VSLQAEGVRLHAEGVGLHAGGMSLHAVVGRGGELQVEDANCR
jgi:hypothetical protein